MLVPGKDDPVRKTQSLALFLQSTAQFAISHQHHLVDWRKLGQGIKNKSMPLVASQKPHIANEDVSIVQAIAVAHFLTPRRCKLKAGGIVAGGHHADLILGQPLTDELTGNGLAAGQNGMGKAITQR